MKKTPYMMKGLAAGIILLFIGLAIAPIISGTNNQIRNNKPTDYDHSTLQVIFTKPENGIYCNDYKILPFPVPLVLWGPITVEVVISNGSGLNRIEFYFNDVLLATITGPGPSYGWSASSWQPFSKIKFKVIAYSATESASDEITIWRLFR
jgi:hypothetical protein